MDDILFARLKKLEPVYKTFKAIQFVHHSHLPELKDLGRTFGLQVDPNCNSCGPELLIQLWRRVYADEKQRRDAIKEEKNNDKNGGK